jgi:hypothetical protein
MHYVNSRRIPPRRAILSDMIGRCVVVLAVVVAITVGCGERPPAAEDVKGPRVVPSCDACDSHHYCYEGPPIRCEAFTVCGASCACALRDVDRASHRCEVVGGQVRVSRRADR